VAVFGSIEAGIFEIGLMTYRTFIVNFGTHQQSAESRPLRQRRVRIKSIEALLSSLLYANSVQRQSGRARDTRTVPGPGPHFQIRSWKDEHRPPVFLCQRSTYNSRKVISGDVVLMLVLHVVRCYGSR
jgi:hypothetical protein